MRWSWGAVTASLVCLAHVGAAQTLQIGSTQAGDPGNAFEMSQYAQAQAFQTSTAFTATSVSFWTDYGGVSPVTPQSGTSGFFDWTIYTDNGGTPGAVVSSGQADQTPIENTPSDARRTEWAFDLPNVALDANTQYWFGIRNTDASGIYQSTSLYWTANIGGSLYSSPSSQYYNSATGEWTQNSATDDAAFGYGNHLTLAIYGDPMTTTTPEPSTLALMGTGLVGLVPMVRRRRAKAS